MLNDYFLPTKNTLCFKLVILSVMMLSLESVFGQAFEVDGTIKIGTLALENACDSVVVVLPDGTLAMRQLGSFGGGEGGSPQTLSISGNELSIYGGNTVTLPSGGGGSNQTLSYSNNTLSISNGNSVSIPDAVDDADADSTNEFQDITLSNDTLFISNGNYAVLEGIGSGGVSQTISISNDTIFLSGGSYVELPPDGINDADADATNELQDLTFNGDTVFISNGDYIVLPGLNNLSLLNITVSERLARGASPKSIYQMGYPLDSIYGQLYKGGYIFYLDLYDEIPGIEGLIAYTDDMNYQNDLSHAWGCTNNTNPVDPVTSNPPFGPTANLGSGTSNTASIVADGCATNFSDAPRLASVFQGGGFDDWFLPSIQEMITMYNNIGPATSINAGFTTDTYWSSTPGGDFGTWKVDFNTGNPSGEIRANELRVRLARAF